MDAKNGKGGVKIKGKAEEEENDPDVTFTATDSDLFDILTGEQDATQAYFGVSCNTQVHCTGYRGTLVVIYKLSIQGRLVFIQALNREFVHNYQSHHVYKNTKLGTCHYEEHIILKQTMVLYLIPIAAIF